MPTEEFISGVPIVRLSKRGTTAIGTIGGITPTIAAEAYTNNLLLAGQKPLVTGEDYSIVVAPLGFQPTRTGYTIDISTPVMVTPISTLAAGEGIRIDITNSALGAVTQAINAICMTIWLKVGAADYQLADFAPIDPQQDFSYMLTHKAFSGVQYIPEATLTAATAHPYLGDRNAYPVVYSEVPTTTGGVQLMYRFNTFESRPDSGVNFQQKLGSAIGMEFRCLTGSIFTLAEAVEGNAVEFVDDNGATRTQAHYALQSALSVVRGCMPIQFDMPPDDEGNVEVVTMLGNVTSNAAEFTRSLVKDANSEITFRLEPAALERLCNRQNTAMSLKIAA